MCNKHSCMRRHEKRTVIPELVAACGCILHRRSPFSLSWLYTKMVFWAICSVLNLYCYWTCFVDTNYYSYFLYFNNWVLLIAWFYFSLSLILTIKVYQNTQPYLLPACLQPLNQYARSNINDLPSIKNLKLSVLAKYTRITFHLTVTNTTVLCVAYWTVEFVHSIHNFEHFYSLSMKLNVVSNYAVLLLIVLFDYGLNATKLQYRAIWYILIMSVIFHIWSAVFNYNAFMYQNDNDNAHADIVRLPSIFIYYDWDQTKHDDNHEPIVSHSLQYIALITLVLYAYMVCTHLCLCFVKSLFLYQWSQANQALIENAFDTEFELNEVSDATAWDDDMMVSDRHSLYDKDKKVMGNGIVVHDKLVKDTHNGIVTSDQNQHEKTKKEKS